jgi:glycosyltransferase involved in cell wall biosynthesis
LISAVPENWAPVARTCTGDRARLLFICNVAWFFVSHRLPLARAALAAGYDVHVAADYAAEREVRDIEAIGARFHRVPLSRGGINPVHDLRLFARLRRLCRDIRPHIVHNVTIKPMIYGSLAARFCGVRGIVNAVSGVGYAFTDGRGGRKLLRSFARLAYQVAFKDKRVHVIFQNEDDQAQFVSGGLIEREHSTIIRGSGVDLARFIVGKPPQEPPVVILMPARALRDKGVVEFAAAAARLRQEGRLVECVLAGGLDPDNPASLTREEVRALEVSSGMKWLGHVDDMPARLAACHIVCLPSYREGLPKALIEACASGRPIVTTDVPGCRDVVADGQNGLLIPSRDSSALAAALARLVDDAEMRARMGTKSRQRAQAMFSVSDVVRQTLAIYERFID